MYPDFRNLSFISISNFKINILKVGIVEGTTITKVIELSMLFLTKNFSCTDKFGMKQNSDLCWGVHATLMLTKAERNIWGSTLPSS